MTDHGASTPSPWICRWAGQVDRGGQVLDVACGAGRHTRLFLSRGHPVIAVDRDVAALTTLGPLPRLNRIAADFESAAPWPISGRFAGVIVTNYLWRPLLPAIVAAVADGGVLLYETFAQGNEAFGRPSNPAFLLQPDELLAAAAPELRIVAYEHGRIDAPRAAVVQRLCAVRSRPPRVLVVDQALASR